MKSKTLNIYDGCEWISVDKDILFIHKINFHFKTYSEAVEDLFFITLNDDAKDEIERIMLEYERICDF